MFKKIIKTEKEWEKLLNPEEYKILREKNTEPPFSGKYYRSKDRGMYICVACGSELFHLIQNLIQVQVGQVFMLHQQKRVWKQDRIKALAWNERRLFVVSAAGT